MKDITTRINETKSKDYLERLKDLALDFMELFDEVDDDSREQLCSDLVRRTIKYDEDYTKGRVLECWQYVADNLNGKWH